MIKGSRDIKNRGQGMVEFALVFPMLLLVLLGIFEFGRLMFAYSAVVSASREAARYGAAILDTGGGIPQYEDCSGIRDAAKRIGKFAGISDTDISIQYSNESGIYSTSCPPSQEVQAADTISVSINAALQPITPLGTIPAIPISSSSSRTILKNVKMGFSGTGAGSVSGALTDVNFRTTSQAAEESKGTLQVILELNEVATDVVTVPFSITGTAQEGAGQDYVITSSPVTINPGQKTATIYVTLNNDGVDEAPETIILGIDAPINATKGPQNIHTITITDPPKVSFKTLSSVHSEADAGTALTVQLSKGSTQDVSVSFSFSGSAVWGASGDYYTSPATVTIPAGSLTAMLMLDFNDDAMDEEDEIATITLTSPVNAVAGAEDTHTLTITDNDAPPEIYFNVPQQWVSEEIGIFTTVLSLSEVSGKIIQLPYTISGTATSHDYEILDSSPLIIPPGSSTAEITLKISEGDGMEEDETLVLTLGSPQNAVLGNPAQQTIIITETSTEPKVSFTKSALNVVEGGFAINADVYLSNAWSSPVEVPFTISGSAEAGVDFTSPASPLIIPVGWTQGTIQVVIKDDTTDEDTENIQLTMGEIVNGLPGDLTSFNIQILDNDAPPQVSFSVSSKSVQESSGTVTVNLEMSAASVRDVTVPLQLSGSATQGTDYSLSTASVLIPAGSTSASFQVNIVDDVTYDPGEKAIIDLGYPTNAEIGSPASFTLLIEDNELPPCEVGTHLMTVDMDSISLSIVNEGESIQLTGGSVSWQEIDPNQPRLTQITFAGTTVFSGSEKPPGYSYSAAADFYTLTTDTVQFSFDGPLGTGETVVVSNFRNPVDGTTCSLTESFTIH